VFTGFTEEQVAEQGFPDALLKRRARNSDIDAFHVREEGPFALYLEEVARYANLPQSVKAWLERPANVTKLRSRAAFQRGDCEWWRYTWPLNRRLYDGPRLICPYRTGRNRYALDADFSYLTLTDTTVAFPREEVEENPAYPLGLLNTRMMTFRFRGLGKLTSANMWESFDNSISELPIRRIDFARSADRDAHDQIVHTVRDIERTLRQKENALSSQDRSIAGRRAEGLSDQLEEIVLDLYGISGGGKPTRDHRAGRNA
jgi:hypothetical protein